MSFTNVYYKRAVGTPKACFICYRPTTTVIATKDVVDFLYTCDAHLSDRGFATPMGETGDGVNGDRKLGLSPEEIQKIKEEWEEKQKRKKEREEKAKQDKKEDKKESDDVKDKDKTKGEGSGQTDNSPDRKKSSPSPISSPAPAGPSHQRYSLHRNIFVMRLSEHRKRRQTAQAKEIAPKLPSAPRAPVAPNQDP